MRCYYCKMPFNTDDPTSEYYPTVDHKLPRSRGGKGGSNKVWACRRCNREKGSRTPTEYREALAIREYVPCPLPHKNGCDCEDR